LRAAGGTTGGRPVPRRSSPSPEPGASRPRRKAPRVLGVIPAHDEEASIARTVKSLAEVEGITGVVVLADGCTDRTAEEATSAGAAIRTLTGFRAEEPLSGQRAVTRMALQACRPLAGGFGLETAMTVDALRLGLRVREVPVEMAHRPTGRSLSGFLHRFGQGADIFRAMVPRALNLR